MATTGTVSFARNASRESRESSTRSLLPSFLLLILSLLALPSARATNVTKITIAAGGKYAACGYFTLDVTMWAERESAWLYVTDADCNEATASPCKPPTNPTLTPVSCVGVASCERSTLQPADEPLCLVVANTDAALSLAVDLQLSGSTVPITSSGGNGGGGLDDFEIVLISVGSAAAVLILVGLVALVSYLTCCRAPPLRQVHPLHPNDDMQLFAAKSLAATPAMAPGMGPRMMTGTMTLLPPAVAGLPAYGGMSYGGMSYGGIPPPALSFARSQAPLAPLPMTAYGPMSPQGGIPAGLAQLKMDAHAHPPKH